MKKHKLIETGGVGRTEFSQDLFANGYSDGIEAHWWNIARSQFIAAQLHRLHLTAANILEVGCGRGSAIKGLSAFGIDICGVELADVEPLPEVGHRIVVGCDALDLPAEQRAGVEVILLLDVIEHIADPQFFLQGIMGCFPALHTVLVTVPARMELWSNYDEYFGHFRRYDIEMLHQLGDGLGIDAHDCKYFFHLPYLPARLMSVLGIKRGVRILPPLSSMQIALHRYISVLMQLANRCIPSRLKGSSALAVYHINS